jgi:long-chain acyl-CoA synthetase
MVIGSKSAKLFMAGENVEPTKLEDVAVQSPLVRQIVVVGQDQRRLGALIVIDKENPSAANLSEDEIKTAIRDDLRKLAAEMQLPIGNCAFINEPFTVENGLLTPTLKIKREAIVKQYKAQIEALFVKDSVQNRGG